MTRTKALERLAVKVMGVKRPPNIPLRDDNNYLLESKALLAWYDDPNNYPCIDVFAPELLLAIRWRHGEGPKTWTPFTDPVQALELAEAWCKLGNKSPRSHAIMYEVTRYPDGKYTGQIHGWIGGDWLFAAVSAPTFADALTGAVCAAEKIKVDE